MKNITAIVGFVLLSLIVINVLNISYPIEIRHRQDNQGDFFVTGEGEVEVVPDVAQVSAGVRVSLAQTAEDARERMTRINNKLIDRVKALGVAEADIKTTNFSVSPEYDYSVKPKPLPLLEQGAASSVESGASGVAEGPPPEDISDERLQNVEFPDESVLGSRDGRIVGYNGNVTLTIKIRDKDNVSKVLNAITASGANQLGSVSFVVDEIDEFEDKAREAAIKDAKARAKKIAKQAGMKLGDVTNVVEGGSAQPYYYDAAVSERALGGVPAVQTDPDIQSGTRTVRSTVTLYFERK